jgi:broad-specificity NMP kinase|tara:strand:- start:2888 stop:3166 length:279 start_codon:yes stop_codon:yes gene_type:complete
MPYIKPEDRETYEPMIDVLMNELRYSDNWKGDLNFIVSTILSDMLTTYGTSYSMLNDMVGVLECAKLELYRRMAAPYEDEKIESNGDVYVQE